MIDMVEDDEQNALVAAATELLAKVARPDFELEQAWSAVADQGWLGIGLAESAGGVGYGLVEQALLFRELGRHAFSPPLFEGVLATAAVAGGDVSGDRASLLGRLVSGQVRVLLAEPDGDGGLVLWDRGDDEAHVLVLTPESVDLVPPGRIRAAPTRPETVTTTVDPRYRLRRVEWDRAGAVAHAGSSVAANLRARALVLSAAQLSGIAARTRDMSVEYAGQRVQYGRPIGTFQAVKHRCSDMAMRAEAAWCMTALAAVGAQNDLTGHLADGLSARVVAADAALTNARDNIQNHGAIGFTAEFPAHRYLTRAHVLAAMVVTTAQARAGLLQAELPW